MVGGAELSVGVDGSVVDGSVVCGAELSVGVGVGVDGDGGGDGDGPVVGVGGVHDGPGCGSTYAGPSSAPDVPMGRSKTMPFDRSLRVKLAMVTVTAVTDVTVARENAGHGVPTYLRPAVAVG
nr:hypothetical protein [Frankia sp. Cppng1_Ct_nod]